MGLDIGIQIVSRRAQFVIAQKQRKDTEFTVVQSLPGTVREFLPKRRILRNIGGDGSVDDSQSQRFRRNSVIRPLPAGEKTGHRRIMCEVDSLGSREILLE